MRGYCGSGGSKDCSFDSGINPTKYAYLIKCCPTTYQNDPCPEFGNYEIGQSYGENGFCNVNNATGTFDVMVGGCGSGQGKDCKTNDGQAVSTIGDCCTTSDVSVQDNNLCGWRWGNYGIQVECPDQYAVAGICGSGRYSDCNGSTQYAGI